MIKLINKKIKEVFMNHDRTHITFVDTDDNKYSFFAIGDCCSSTYFDSVEGLDCLINHKILEIEDTGGSFFAQENENYQQFYGIKIKTEKGLFEIIYRNDSNGYYGGSVEEAETHTDIPLLKDFIGEEYLGTEYAKHRMYRNLLKEEEK